MQKKNRILADVAEYYSSKLLEFGETPKGVDWNGEESQILRFEQLCKLLKGHNTFSVNDLGCGYGALFDFLSKRYSRFTYSGIDVSENMISAAKKRYIGKKNARFLVSNEPDIVSDYCIASGIFNVRLQKSTNEWSTYLVDTLDILHQNSQLGFAFNCLTSYSDQDKMRNYLYYSNPCEIFDLCKNRYSRNVALMHDYDLFEFTILVRK